MVVLAAMPDEHASIRGGYLKITFIVFMSIIFLGVSMAIACTIFTVSNGETVLFGGNEDQRSDDTYLIIDKNGIYGVVYFASPMEGIPLLRNMGINEKGLCYDMNLIPEEKITPHPERKFKRWTIKRPGKEPQKEWVIYHLIKECATVEEVLSKIFTFDFGESVSGQFHFADKSGDAAVIHPGADRELTYTRKNKGSGYLISTNFNLAALNETHKRSDRKRYYTADTMLSKILNEKDVTIPRIASVLNATHQNRWFLKTRYSVVYDIRNLRINLYYNRQFKAPVVLDVNQELARNTEFRKIALKALISVDKPGDI